MTRKERRLRVYQLAQCWAQEALVGLCADETPEQLYERFQKFCDIMNISQPQDTTLRDHIIMLAGDILEQKAQKKRRFYE